MFRTQAMENGIQNEIEVDLAVIGGGPTGLLSAYLAQGLGLSFCLIDAKPGPLELGRADALNARTQQYLEIVGILDELLAQGIKCNTSSTFADGEFKSRQSHWWTGLEHALHKDFLMIGQPVVEQILASRLDAASIHYNETAVSISETDIGVTTTTSSGRHVRSKYAIAADGARSAIRSALGISFTGTKPLMTWAVLDTFLDTNFPLCNEIITFQLDGQSRVSWIPRERGMARFYVLLDGEITLEKAHNSIKEHMAPIGVEFTKTEWFSTFEVKERIASTFVSKHGAGRIFLAGDAAHVHSVNGGQGLNTGIADAFALAWRVAIIVKHKGLKPDATEKLIRSYDIERRSVAQAVINVAATLVRNTVYSAKKYVGSIEQNAAYITGMGISYEGYRSPLVCDSEQGFWRAGRRCPDIYLTRLGQETTDRLYSLLSYGKYLVLMTGKHHDCGEFVRGLTTCLTILPKGCPGEIGKEDSADGSNSSSNFSADFVAEGDSYVVVVRPDMYIGFVGAIDEAKRYMEDLFLD